MLETRKVEEIGCLALLTPGVIANVEAKPYRYILFSQVLLKSGSRTPRQLLGSRHFINRVTTNWEVVKRYTASRTFGKHDGCRNTKLWGLEEQLKRVCRSCPGGQPSSPLPNLSRSSRGAHRRRSKPSRPYSCIIVLDIACL